MIDRFTNDVLFLTNSVHKGEWICIQHSVVVLSFFALIMTTLGVINSWNRWTYIVPSLTAVILCLTSLPILISLSIQALRIFILFALIDCLVKMFAIVDLVLIREQITAYCLTFNSSKLYHCPGSPDECRLIIINCTTGLVFIFIAFLINCILLLSSGNFYYIIKKTI